jgi:hypothetical protein
LFVMKKKLLLAIIPVITSWLLAGHVSALTVSPAMRDFYRPPGSEITETVHLYNETSMPQTYYPRAVDFVAPKDESGTPLWVDSGTSDHSYSMSKWINVADTAIPVAPGERKDVKITINVPNNAEPGSYSAGLLFLDQKPSDTNVGLAGQVGPIFLLNVDGVMKEDMKVLTFDLENKDKLNTALPIRFLLRMQNDGTVHQIPRGAITIHGWWPKTRIIAVNPNNLSHVLPRSVRRLTPTWNGTPEQPSGFLSAIKYEYDNLAFGRFKADLNLEWGVQKNETINQSLTFWIIPWHLGLAVLGCLILLYLFLKGYNKILIGRAMRNK